MHQLTSVEETRAFLVLCLDPGHGIKRTPAKVAEVMPQAIRDHVEADAPRLTALRQEAERLEAAAAQARAAHATAFHRWLTSPDATTTPEREHI